MSERPALDPERLIRIPRVCSVAPSPCGTWAAVAVARLDAEGGKYISDLWRVPLDGSGAAVQLTRGPSDDRAPCFRRDGALGFLSNRNPREGKPEEGDDERAQVWVLPPEGGEPRPLTDEPLGVSEFSFAAQGDRLLVIAPVLPDVPHDEQRARMADLKKNGPSVLRYDRSPARYWDHWLGPWSPHLIAYDENGGNRRDLTPEAQREHREAGWDISRDGRRVVISLSRPGEDRANDVALLLIDLETDERTVLGESPRTSLARPRFSPGGNEIACSRTTRQHEALGKTDLWIFRISGDSGSNRTYGWDRWPAPQDWTDDGASVLVTADDAGSVSLFLVSSDGNTGTVTRITPGGGTLDCVSVVPGQRAAIGVRARTHHAPEVFRVALEKGAEPELVSHLGAFAEEEGRAIAEWEWLSAKSDDGTAVPYLVVRPAGHKEGDAPLPVVMWIHGGPVGQWAEGWHWRWNPLIAASRGYVVVLPNPAGSTGQGQAQLERIWGNDWGGRCYGDLMAVADAVEQLPYVDRTRFAAMGGSFGGYMTNWIGGHTDRFRCLITHASLWSFPMFHGTTDIPVWFGYHIGASRYGAREAYDTHSPDHHLDQWKSPVLITHGEKDYRVPVGESLALFEGLQHRGVPSEMVIFPDENHWILKPRNTIAWYNAVLEFLDRHLKP
jgi:dipeptidyl aminopeptidase/acylaminoacyl peptidase